MFDPTVHLDEGVRLPRRSGMEEACQDVLADASLAPDQQGNSEARTLSYRHEVEDASSFQDGRYPSFGRRDQSGQSCWPPGLWRQAPLGPNCGIGVEARRSLRSRQCVFSRTGKLFPCAKSRWPRVVIHLPADLSCEPSSARVSIRKTQVILDLLAVRARQTVQFFGCGQRWKCG